MKRIFSLLTFLSFTVFLGAQSVAIPQEDISITVTGTSTVHDWEVIAQEPTINLSFTDESKTTISQVSVAMQVSNMVSGKSLMDSKMHDALGAKKTPTISFKGDFSSISQTEAFVEGTLEIKGNKKPAKVNLVLENGIVKGSYEMNMIDFKVDPPTAMMGAISTGEVVTIHFEVKLPS